MIERKPRCFWGSASFSAIAGSLELPPMPNLVENVFNSWLNKVSYLTREVLIHKFWLRDDFFLTGQPTP